MKADAEAVEKELRSLRRVADDGVTPEVMAAFPLLCQLLGRGDPFLAGGGLRDRLGTAAARGDRDVLAFLYSLQARGDATARIGAAGERLSVEYRRARDLSDRGIVKMAEHIASDADWQVPFMGVMVDVRDRQFTVRTFVQCARGFVGFRHPKHIVDGAQIAPEHRVTESGLEERHTYGPVAVSLVSRRHSLRVRRIGSHDVRASVYYTSDNPRVRLHSQLAYLTYAIELTLDEPQSRASTVSRSS